MSTAEENSVTTPVDETEVEAEAERIFAEAADAREGKPADPPAEAEEGAAAETQGSDEDRGATAGADQGEEPGQSGGSEGAAAAAAASGEGDIWADAKPEQKAAFEAADKAREKAEQQFKSREGREAALQRQIADLKRQGGGGQGEQPRKPLKELLTAENITGLKADYPDLVPLIDALAETGERLDGVTEQVGQVKSATVAVATGAEEKALNKAVPNWLELAQDERFLGWVEDQPKKLRDAVSANWDAITDAERAAEVFTSFAEHIKPGDRSGAEGGSGGSGDGGAQGKRQRQAQGAKGTTVTAPPSAGGDSEDPDVLFAQAAAKVDRSRDLRT